MVIYSDSVSSFTPDVPYSFIQQFVHTTVNVERIEKVMEMRFFPYKSWLITFILSFPFPYVWIFYKHHLFRQYILISGHASSVGEASKSGFQNEGIYDNNSPSCCSKVLGVLCGCIVKEDCRNDEEMQQGGEEEALFCTLCNAEVLTLFDFLLSF